MRARHDLAFRRKLAVSSLQNLIGLMTALRAGPEAEDPQLAAHLREGADLAVQLSEIIKRLPEDDATPVSADSAKSGKALAKP